MGTFWWIALAGFFMISGLVFSIHQIDFEFAVAHGLTVPDSINMTQTMQYGWDQGSLLGPESDFKTVAGLYGWTWFIHPSLCFAINCLFMLANAVLVKRVVIGRLKAPAWALLGLLANPYLMLAMPGPNKEIPLVFLTLLFVDALLRTDRRWWLATALCILMYLLRDGYGLLMLVLIGLARLLGPRERLLPFVVFVLTVSAASLWSSLAQLIPAMQRNLSIYYALFDEPRAVGSVAAALALDPFSPMGGLLLYVLRLAYNLVSLAFFPVFFTEDGNLFWIGLAYWIYGLMTLMACIGCTCWWLSKQSDTHQRLSAALALCTWFIISLSLFIQPRYFMPMLPIAFCVMAALPPHLRFGSITLTMALALTVISVLALTDRSPPPAIPEVMATPAYVW